MVRIPYDPRIEDFVGDLTTPLLTDDSNPVTPDLSCWAQGVKYHQHQFPLRQFGSSCFRCGVTRAEAQAAAERIQKEIDGRC